MKLTAAQLRSIIKEETKRALREGPEGPGSGPLPAPGPGPDVMLMRSVEALSKIADDLDAALAIYPRSENYSKVNVDTLKSVIDAVTSAAQELETLTG